MIPADLPAAWFTWPPDSLAYASMRFRWECGRLLEEVVPMLPLPRRMVAEWQPRRALCRVDEMEARLAEARDRFIAGFLGGAGA